MQAPQRGGQRGRVAGRDDEPGLLVADEPAGGGPDRGGGDHGYSLVEGFVDHQPPRLEEVARGDRRYDDDVRAGVEVAHFLRARGAGRDRAGRDGPGRNGPSPTSSSARSSCRARPEPLQARSSTARPFSPSSRPANRAWNGAWRRGAAGALQNASSTLCGASTTGPRAPLRAHVGGDVRAVGGDRVRVAVDVAQRQVGERVRGGARVAPDRRPQHERDARGARAGVGGGQRDAARQPGHHGAEAPGGGERGRSPAALGRSTGNGGGSAAAAPPWRSSPPTSANTTSSAACSAAKAPIRKAGAWLVTNRTGRGSCAPVTAAPPRRPRRSRCRTAPT